MQMSLSFAAAIPPLSFRACRGISLGFFRPVPLTSLNPDCFSQASASRLYRRTKTSLLLCA